MRNTTVIFAALFALLLMSGAQQLFAAALSPSTTYSVTIQKIGSDGQPVTPGSTTTGTTDANGKLSFSLTNVPTSDTANFLLVMIKNAGNQLVKQAVIPAPPANDKNFIGINDMSDLQANTLLTMLTAAGSDDPVLVSMGLLILRSSQTISSTDANIIGEMGTKAIIASGDAAKPSMEEYLASSSFGNISSAKITKFKQCLVFNNFSTTAGRAKSIRDFAKGFYDANQQAAAADAQKEVQKAGGLMADIFMDAAICAGIPAGKILAAHDAAGDVANPIMATVSAGLKDATNQAMTSFYKRIALKRVGAEYNKALVTLGATDAQKTKFLNAIRTMSELTAKIDADYGWFFDSPTDANALAHGHADAVTVRGLIDTAFSNAFSQFQTLIGSDPADIAAMKTKVKQGFGATDQMIPQDFGYYYDMSGVQQPWPIPQTVMVSKLADWLIAGGTFGYTRDTTPLPVFVVWMGACTNDANGPHFEKTGCEQNGGTWTAGRQNFSFIPDEAAMFRHYLELQQDVNIIEMSRYEIYNNGGQPTKEQERDAKTLFENRMTNLKNLISGKKDASTQISDEERSAIVKLLMQPSTE